MNTDDRRGPGPDEEPTVIGSGLRDVETRLRAVLEAEARTMMPSDRLGAILREAHTTPVRATRPTHHRWLMMAAAAAAVAAVALGSFWVAGRPDRQTPIVPATSPTASSAVTPTTTTPSSVPTETATPTSGPTSAPPEVSSLGLPVYYVGPRSTVEGAKLGLFREFVRTDVAGTDPEAKALAALRVAMGASPQGSTYLSAWQGVSPQQVTVASDVIVVRLSSGSPAQGDVAGFATEQLVWTVQAAAGKGLLPVRFELSDGGSEVAPGHPVSQAYNRPSKAADAFAVLAPLWIDEPARGATFPVGARVTVKGQASTFEANVQWQLLRAGAEVAKSYTTATIGAPDRGTYAFRTGALTAGSYVIRVFELSPKDGSVSAEQRIPFTVK